MPADVLLFTAPSFEQVSASSLMAAAPASDELKQQIATLQQQVADLTARVTALEEAATAPP